MATVVLIILNVLVFIVLKAIGFHDAALVDGFVSAAGVSSSATTVYLAHPWSVLSYMFIHLDARHLLVNMLWLVSFGLMLERASGARSMLLTYFSGGIAGAMAFPLLQITSPHSGYLIGSSAAVLSVAMAALCSNASGKVALPDNLRILLTAMAWLAAGLFLLNATNGSATQAAAHITGSVAGITAGLLMARRSRRLLSAAHTAALLKAECNALLDKANLNGYATLSTAERERLFEISGRKECTPPYGSVTTASQK